MKEFIVRTPLLRHADIFLKPENLQPFGSYKIRGVISAVQSAPRELIQQGLITASAGNMAQAVAFVAREMGIESRIYVPSSAPEVKKQAIRRLGGRLIELPFQEIWDMVRTPPHFEEGVFIHPALTPGLLKGYGQIAEELLNDRPSLDAVVIPFGVGGLTIGVGRKLKELKPSLQVYACEVDAAAPLFASLQAGRALQIERKPSFVDAIGTPEVLSQVFAEVRMLIAGSIVVSLDEVRRAVGTLALKSKLVCEGAAATSLAAALRLAAENPQMEIACVLTGGNLPPEIFEECLERSTHENSIVETVNVPGSR